MSLDRSSSDSVKVVDMAGSWMRVVVVEWKVLARARKVTIYLRRYVRLICDQRGAQACLFFLYWLHLILLVPPPHTIPLPHTGYPLS